MGRGSFPQRLKPHLFAIVAVRPKGRTLQKHWGFSAACKLVPLIQSKFSGSRLASAKAHDRVETVARSAEALLPPHKCGGCHHVSRGFQFSRRLLSASCTIRLGADDFRMLDFGPEGCGTSPSGGGFAIDEAEGHQLLESEVDPLFAYMAIEQSPDLDPG
jgi:hypothetical protein